MADIILRPRCSVVPSRVTSILHYPTCVAFATRALWENMTSSTNPEVTYCNGAREEPSQDHRQHAQKIWWSSDMWFLEYVHGQTRRQSRVLRPLKLEFHDADTDTFTDILATRAISRSYFYGKLNLSLIHIWRCRRSYACRSRWSPYH